MARLEFFFDCSSPWTYLAFHRVGEVAAEAGAELVWRPILVGGVFNAVNPRVYEQRGDYARAMDSYKAFFAFDELEFIDPHPERGLVVTVPVNRWMIARGRGHAVVHELHHA